MDYEGDLMKVMMLPVAPINHMHLQTHVNVGHMQSLDSGAYSNKSSTQVSTCHYSPAYRNTFPMTRTPMCKNL